MGLKRAREEMREIMGNRAKTELERAADELKKEYSQEKLSRLLEEMEKSQLCLPATLPPDTDPAVIKKMAETSGVQSELPEGVSPRPGILQNGEGNRFLSVFTSEEEAMKGKSQPPLLLTVPFQACMELLKNEENLSGIVLNAFSHNIILNANIEDRKPEEQEQIELTEPQLHAVLRQQVEAVILPQAFYNQGEELIEGFQKNGAKLILDIYQQIYPEEIVCPYTEGDFDIMSLNISERLLIMQISMPADRLVSGTCPMVFVCHNPLDGQLRYFGIVLGEQGQKPHILEAKEDGSKEDLGDAPAEGSELQYLIELCR